MIFHVAQRILPAAYSLLPPEMGSRRAAGLLLAIGLQESRFRHRRQIDGPARSFWQFEMAGVGGVLSHAASREHALAALKTLCYRDVSTVDVYRAIEHNDVLACVFARLLLWTLPETLPDEHDYEEGWRQYLRAWRPGKPHVETWLGSYGVGWSLVTT